MPDQSTASELGKTLLVMPNVDDDDLDGKRDCDDGAVNGPFDIEDLTCLEIPFRVVQDDVEISGAGRNLFNVVTVEPTHRGGSKIYIEAKGPRTTASSATITAEARGRKRSFLVDVRPFLLTSSLQRATTVFVVEIPTSKTLVSTLKRLFNEMEEGPALSLATKLAKGMFGFKMRQRLVHLAIQP